MPEAAPVAVPAVLHVNGAEHRLDVDTRSTLVDVLRERLGLTGTKKSCDRGECGACTVHLDGRPALACMTLAVLAEGREIRTIEGIGGGGARNPPRRALPEGGTLPAG